VSTRTRRLNDAALILVALLISVRAALTNAEVGDYPVDARPAIEDLLHGRWHAFGAAHPAMGVLSLLVRAPFAAIAYLGHPSELNIYRWGAVPCVLSVAVLALWLARIARRRGTGVVGQWAIVLVAILNPLVTDSLSLGHPEELLTASLCVGALVAATERRSLLSAVLLGLALACKQWSVVVILPVLFAIERHRLRAFAEALGLAILVTLPEMLVAPGTFLHNQISLAHSQQTTPSVWSWMWPLAPNVSKHVVVEGHTVTVVAHRVPLSIGHAVHAVMVFTDFLVAAIVARVRGLPLRTNDAFALMTLVLLLRCTLDGQSNVYYHAPLFLSLLAWDAVRGERLPIRGLATAGIAYLLFDRLIPADIGAASSFIYAGVTITGVILLVRTLARRPAARPQPVAPRPPRMPVTA
jgi:hypothetical protein